MARYVDADRFEKECAYLRARLEFPDGTKTNGWWAVLTSVQIKDAPTEDVVPVIHADWVGVNHLVDTIECSHCGYEWFTCEIATPYCPECGATMDNYKEISEIGLPTVEVQDGKIC